MTNLLDRYHGEQRAALKAKGALKEGVTNEVAGTFSTNI